MKVVFDLDGTLADCTARVDRFITCPKMGAPHRRTGPVDWDAFYDACDEDLPIIPNILTLHALHEAGHNVQIWTGRRETVIAKTEEWLLMHGVPPKVIDTLRMRPIGFYGKDHEMKLDWGRCYGMPDLVFEDRDRVVNLWREHGVQVNQVAYGAF